MIVLQNAVAANSPSPDIWTCNTTNFTKLVQWILSRTALPGEASQVLVCSSGTQEDFTAVEPEVLRQLLLHWDLNCVLEPQYETGRNILIASVHEHSKGDLEVISRHAFSCFSSCLIMLHYPIMLNHETSRWNVHRLSLVKVDWFHSSTAADAMGNCF